MTYVIRRSNNIDIKLFVGNIPKEWTETDI